MIFITCYWVIYYCDYWKTSNYNSYDLCRKKVEIYEKYIVNAKTLHRSSFFVCEAALSQYNIREQLRQYVRLLISLNCHVDTKIIMYMRHHVSLWNLHVRNVSMSLKITNAVVDCYQKISFSWKPGNRGNTNTQKVLLCRYNHLIFPRMRHICTAS